MSTRRCPRCKYEKSVDEFYKRGTGKYAGQPYGWCRPCHSKYGKARYKYEPEYREAALKKAREFYRANPLHCQARMDEWRLENHDFKLAGDLAHWHTVGKFRAQERRQQQRQERDQ